MKGTGSIMATLAKASAFVRMIVFNRVEIISPVRGQIN